MAVGKKTAWEHKGAPCATWRALGKSLNIFFLNLIKFNKMKKTNFNQKFNQVKKTNFNQKFNQMKNTKPPKRKKGKKDGSIRTPMLIQGRLERTESNLILFRSGLFARLC